MISMLRGQLVEVTEDTALVDVGGVGYEVKIPESTRNRLAAKGQTVILHTHLALRQDGVTLYGFGSPAELRLFNHLISVGGVGPKMALAVISMYSPDRFYAIVLNEDVSALTAVPGVGTKTAQRIILELRDKIGVSKRREQKGKEKPAASSAGEDILAEAVEALMALGYGRSEATVAVETVISQSGLTLPIEDLITRTLRTLARI